MPILTLPIARAVPAEIESLLDAAFGVDRHGRTAYRLRQGVAAIPELSFASFDHTMLVGVVQCWPVELVPEGAASVPLVLLGPVAVVPDRQQHGIGRTLMRAALATADAIGAPPLMLIGDPEYYERLFGFHAAPAAEWQLPGPFERRRLLVRLRGERTLPRVGHVRPRQETSPVQPEAAIG